MSHRAIAVASHIGSESPIEIAIELGRARLLSRIKISERGCWEYQGFIGAGGYGQINWRGRNWAAHRLAFRLWKGEIPDGADILHSCDNRRCCNPDHLNPGTNHENVIDCAQKGRNGQAAKTHCKRGHEFTPENTRIRANGSRDCRACEVGKWKREVERRAIAKVQKITCVHGHPLTGENLYITSDGRRRCRECHYRHVRESAARYRNSTDERRA